MTMARTKKLDRKYLDHLAGVLRPIIDERFGGNATAFAAHVGVSQPQIAQLLRQDGGDRGVGIVVLMAFRKYLNMSIDDMLGLPRVAQAPLPVSELEDAIQRALDRKFPASEPAILPMAPPTTARRKKPE